LFLANGIIQKKGKAAFNSIDVEDLILHGFYLFLTIFEDGEATIYEIYKKLIRTTSP